ncbi:MAG: hypothetical protein DLM71_07015 [Chloroflexi bacterium]|nr:MAG: hypothetical protein DLM71_07015 [Chloroflexota bacterium]
MPVPWWNGRERAIVRVVVVGAGGQLGSALVERWRGRGDEVLALGRAELDLDAGDGADGAAGLPAIVAFRPAVVVNAAAWTDVDGCARDPQRAMRVNGIGAGLVAGSASQAGAVTVQISTNEVFDGSAHRPYREDDEPSPINPYGRSKLAGEEAVRAANPRSLVVRTAWLFGGDRPSFATKIRAAAERSVESGRPLRVVADEIGNPTPVRELARAIVELVDRLAGNPAEAPAATPGTAGLPDAPGIYHLAGEPAVSRLEWARQLLGNMPGLRLEPISLADYPRPAPVPPRAVLDVGRAAALDIGAIRWEASVLA